ncbi:MAG: T9SS type A sorting domain-containing protein [Bacteroidetes bacterium]|nr:T9SS type A sorting domain-containing protein [Bacteroidota bacterium]
MMRAKFLLFLQVLCSFAFCQQFPIGSLDVVFQDPERNNRNIPTEVYYPAVLGGAEQAAAEGQFPVIIIGHGFLMDVSAYQNYVEEYVPQGFIVALPKTEGNLFPNHSAFGRDLAYLVNGITQAGSAGTGILSGHVQSDFAIMGHSMGGGASFLAAQANDNINTVIGLAPAETNPSAIAAATGVTVPTLIFSGDADGVTPIGQHSGPIYEAIDGPCKQHIILEGGGHCNFANPNFACSFGEVFVTGSVTLSRQEQHEKIYTFLTPWLEARLKGNEESLVAFFNLVDTELGILAQAADCSFTPVCPSPSNLTSSKTALDDILLDWDDIAIAESYEIRGRAIGSPNWVNRSTIASELSLMGIPVNQEFEWQVRTVCDAVVDFRSEYSALGFFDSFCPTPQGSITTLMGPNSVMVSWEPVALAVGYTVNGGPVGQGLPFTFQATGTQLSTNNLQAGTVYEWTVSARCLTGLGETLSIASSAQTFETGTALAPLSTLFGIEAKVYPNPTDGLLRFKESSNITAYRIYDAEGQLILAESGLKQSATIDLRARTAGIYVLEYLEGNEWNSLQIIKE